MNSQKLLLAVVSTTVYANQMSAITARGVKMFIRDTDYRPETSLADRLLQCNYKQCSSEGAKRGRDLAILVNNLVKFGPASYFNLHEEGRYMDSKRIDEQLSDWKFRRERYIKPFWIGIKAYLSAYEPYYKSIGSGIPAQHFWSKSRMDKFFNVKFNDIERTKKSIRDYLVNIRKYYQTSLYGALLYTVTVY